MAEGKKAGAVATLDSSLSTYTISIASPKLKNR